MTKLLASMVIGASLLTGTSLTRAQEHRCELNDLTWMVGRWRSEPHQDRVQERWALAPNAILMGSFWEFPEGKPGFAEMITIRSDGPSIVMIMRHFSGDLKSAWEERNAPMVFTASTCGPKTVLFDGNGDHVGEHIAYHRFGDRETISADFLRKGVPEHMEWHMTRAGD